MPAQEFIVVAFVAAALIAVLVYRLQRQKKPNGSSLKSHLPMPSERVISIVALGHEQAGKTVLMASMWRELGISGGRGVELRADHEPDRKTLLQLCRQIEDASEPFPSGTTLGEEKNWPFTVRACDANGQFADVCKITYYDYPGEYLDRAASGGDPGPDFAYMLNSADIIVGLIDGQMVLHLMENRLNGAADEKFAARLSGLCYTLNEMKQKTLHIIITKWDLLQGRYELAQVITCLKNYSSLFTNLLETPRPGRVRVIPVSALGINGFAYEDHASGVIRKSANRPWLPMQVIAPLACTIPDVIATEARQLTAARTTAKPRQIISREYVSTVFFWFTVALRIAVPHVAPATAVAASPAFADLRQVALKVPADKIVETVTKLINRHRRQGNRAHAGMPAVPGAAPPDGLVQTLSYLRSEVERLEAEFPAAR